jgi:predicted RNA-binding Zn-ribbon protein involved in translation (DUF1610 family)
MRIGCPGRILTYYYESRLGNFGLNLTVDRFFKEGGGPVKYDTVKRQLYYLPFYRFRGMAYSLLSEVRFEDNIEPDLPVLPGKTVYQQRCRSFDLTVPAFEEKAFVLDSLGVRPEVMPLTAFTNDALPRDAIRVDLTVSPENARKLSMGMFALNLGVASEGKSCVISEMVGDGLSVIYYPVWAYAVRKDGHELTFILDGLAKSVISVIPGLFEYRPTGKDISQAGILTPIQHKCPSCGFNLPTSECSLHYHCANCGKSYMLKTDTYQKVETISFQYEPAAGHYPFWRFPFITGENLKTVADFSKILTGEIPLLAKNKARMPFYLYIPAFRIPDLEILTGRGLRLCRTQPILSPANKELKPEAELVLPENEALKLAKFYWTSVRSRYKYLDKEMFEFKPQDAGPGELIWLTMTPFRPNAILTEKKQAQLSE